ncbi:MAG: asparaginase [Eubacteriales bacterium]|nr:asparaginase [Eubacteriales bacterium]
MDSGVLTREYRGNALDNVHRGHLAIVDKTGRVVFSVGDPEAVVFYRSASKPIQALPAIAARLDEAYGITERESVIFAGSHTGEPFHMEALESIFQKAGLKEDDLIMQPSFPAHVLSNEARLNAGLIRRRLYHNCAGKHAALMLVQRHAGADIKDYWKAGGAADAAVRRAIETVGEHPIAADGVDGCGVPVFAVPVKGIATAYKNLACPGGIKDDALASAAARFVPRINQNPRMMRGTGFLCGHINEDENLIAKGGAAGVYGLGLKKEGLGVAFKVESGSEDAWPNIVMAVLRGLNALRPETEAMLEKLGASAFKNDCGAVAGRREAGFRVAL